MNIENTPFDIITLAAQCAACNAKPPLRTSMSALIKAIHIKGTATLRELLDMLPIDEDTVMQQLSRLVKSGIVTKRRNKCATYWLSADGKRLINDWRRDTIYFIEQITKHNNHVQQG